MTTESAASYYERTATLVLPSGLRFYPHLDWHRACCSAGQTCVGYLPDGRRMGAARVIGGFEQARDTNPELPDGAQLWPAGHLADSAPQHLSRCVCGSPLALTTTPPQREAFVASLRAGKAA